MPKVSIIIPLCHAENSLEKCLKSICSQTLSDMEILCLSDCSYAVSPNMLQKLPQNDTRIKCIDFPHNTGMAAAKNRAIEHAQGEYIGFVDSEDFVDLDFYEKLYHKAKETNADCVMGNLKEIDRRGVMVQSDTCSQVEKNKFLFSYAPAAIYKKDFLLAHSIFFPLKGGHFADSVFEVLVASSVKKIITTDVSSYYRNNPSYAETDDILKKLKDAVIALKMRLLTIISSKIMVKSNEIQ